MGWDETGIPVPGCKIPGWDRDRDEFSGISGIRDGTGMSFGKPGWDRDASFNPGIPDLFEIEKNLADNNSDKNETISVEPR